MYKCFTLFTIPQRGYALSFHYTHQRVNGVTKYCDQDGYCPVGRCIEQAIRDTGVEPVQSIYSQTPNPTHATNAAIRLRWARADDPITTPPTTQERRSIERSFTRFIRRNDRGDYTTTAQLRRALGLPAKDTDHA